MISVVKESINNGYSFKYCNITNESYDISENESIAEMMRSIQILGHIQALLPQYHTCIQLACIPNTPRQSDDN